jgi:dihydroorotase
MNPPLREAVDVEAVKTGLKDGTIDAIATDHAPHHLDEKDVEFNLASNGIIGLETSLALCLSLVRDGVMDLKQLVEKMSLNPAKILNINRGTLQVGAIADITIIDPKADWVVLEEDLCSKSKNSPFIGEKMTGQAAYTIVSGKIVYRRG